MRTAKAALISLATLTFLSSGQANALSATFNNGTARYGSCLKPLDAPASQVLAQYGVRVGSATKASGKSVRPTGGSDADLQNTTAMILQRVKEMGGTSVLSAVRNLKVWSVADLDISGRQTGQGLCLHSSNNKNFALVAHELGHRVGNASWYAKYNRAVRSRCAFTKYSTASHGNGPRNEEFAEVFAAYVTNPNLLKNGPPACQQAYQFLKQNMFKNSPNECEAVPSEGTDAHTLEDCDSPNEHKNHRDLEEAAEALEMAAHVQENGGSWITQFAEMTPMFMQALQQRKLQQQQAAAGSSSATSSILSTSSSAPAPTVVTAPASSGAETIPPEVANPGDTTPFKPPTSDSVIRSEPD